MKKIAIALTGLITAVILITIVATAGEEPKVSKPTSPSELSGELSNLLSGDQWVYETPSGTEYVVEVQGVEEAVTQTGIENLYYIESLIFN